ncbi:MAG: cation:proton antiporter [Patescibacteria group bacterium]|nr:cation:proton antiporter [Patescibacteria group bacterium]
MAPSRNSSPLAGFLPYTILIAVLTLLSVVAQLVLTRVPEIGYHIDFQIFVIGAVLFIGYYINRIAPKTIIPSFVWAIFAGLAIQPFLGFLTADMGLLKVVMEVFAAIILFQGGIEISFKTFRKWFFPIISLSVIGVVISAVFFGAVLYFVLQIFMPVSAALVASIVVVSAALASTDPAALLPTFERMRFRRQNVRDVAIAESELSDITGSIFTQTLLLALITVGAANYTSIFAYFLPVVQKSTYDSLALLIVSGIIVGYLGYRIIRSFYYHPSDSEKQGDPALLLAVPIFTYSLGTVLGGAGFFAAFVAGLLTDEIGGLKKVSYFYESLISHMIKPFIFIVLGALIPLPILIAYAPVGIIAALLFMFLIRPLAVFVSLAPWLFKHQFTLKDVLFLSFIRETGIIPAVLIIIASAYDVIQSDFAISVGMWVILMTLIVEPPLTPYVARKLGIGTLRKDTGE